MITGLVRVSPSLHFWKKHCPIHRQLVGQNSVTGNVDSLCAPEEKELGWASSQSAITGKPPGIPGTTERLHDKKKKRSHQIPFSPFSLQLRVVLALHQVHYLIGAMCSWAHTSLFFNYHTNRKVLRFPLFYKQSE